MWHCDSVTLRLWDTDTVTVWQYDTVVCRCAVQSVWLSRVIHPSLQKNVSGCRHKSTRLKAVLPVLSDCLWGPVTAVGTLSEYVMPGVRRRASPCSVPFTRHTLHGFQCHHTYDLVSSLTVNGTRCRRSRLISCRDDDDDDDDDEGNNDVYIVPQSVLYWCCQYHDEIWIIIIIWSCPSLTGVCLSGQASTSPCPVTLCLCAALIHRSTVEYNASWPVSCWSVL